MLQLRGRLDLGEKALGAERGGEIGVQHLDRDVAIVPEVVREVDRRHAAGAELALDAVAVCHGCPQSFENFRHWRPARWALLTDAANDELSDGLAGTGSRKLMTACLSPAQGNKGTGALGSCPTRGQCRESALPGYPVILAMIARSAPHAVVLRIEENRVDGTRGSLCELELVSHSCERVTR